MSDNEKEGPIKNIPDKVGYGKPPKDHRFKKGKSGNPKGRPRQLKSKKPKPDAYQEARMFSKILQAESNRPLKLKEGGNVSEITVLAGAIRALGVSAVKGSRLAQRDLLKLVRDDEQARRESIEKELESIVEYRQLYRERILEIERQGLSDEIFLHHPDDFILNPETGEADVNGPVTLEEKEHWDNWLKKRDDFMSEIKLISVAYSSETCSSTKEWHLHDWHVRQKCFDILNDNLPIRYRTELVHRSMRDGASQPGDQKRRHWPGEDD